MLTAFPRGLYAHVRGIRFAAARKGYLALAAIPFALTLILYAGALGLLLANGDSLPGLFWPSQGAATGGATGALYWLYAHAIKYLLYCLTLVLMYFCFMVTANILAAPLYEHIAARLAGLAEPPGAASPSLPFWRSMLEEAKKALFVAAIPLLLVFVPLVGPLLAPLAAAILLAFDFMDFSLCRDEPRFAGRLRYLARRPFLLLGFGLPLLIPVVNMIFFPFAILGASLLYLESTGRHLPAK